MTTPDPVARRRWLALSAIRLAGMGGAMLGMILASRATTTGPRVLGIALVISALLMIAVVPAGLAHRWRSRTP